MNRRVVVTGLGIVSSLGHKVEEVWQRILRGDSGIHALTLFDTERFKVKLAARSPIGLPAKSIFPPRNISASIASLSLPWWPVSTPSSKAASISPRKTPLAAVSSSAPASAACTKLKNSLPASSIKAPTAFRPSSCRK